MNSIVIIGNLTKDPEIYESKNATVATLTVAVNSFSKDEEIATYFTVKTFNKVAENCKKYLAKGKKVAVRGEMRTRDYEDKDGNSRVVWELIASEIKFLSTAEEKKTSKRR